MSASSLSSGTDRDFPADGSPRQKLLFAMKYAALAPTETAWQPWHFRVAETHLELMTKSLPEREMIDPDRRELLIGCGSALFYLKLALKHFGWLGRVELFPDLGEPALVARIHFGACCERDAGEKILFDALAAGRANPSVLGGTPVTETMLAALRHAAAGERGWLDFVQSETSRQQVLKITLAGEPAPRGARSLLAFGTRDADSWNRLVEPVRQPVVREGTLAVVKTKTDEKHGWLEAGQTMARTILEAQALGLAWEFFDPVRRPEAREALRLGVGHKGFAQVILRFGPLTADVTAAAAAVTHAGQTICR
jgi:hypothetical protein